VPETGRRAVEAKFLVRDKVDSCTGGTYGVCASSDEEFAVRGEHGDFLRTINNSLLAYALNALGNLPGPRIQESHVFPEDPV
jgi:hypothetical protein